MKSTITYEEAFEQMRWGEDYTSSWDPLTFCKLRMYSYEHEALIGSGYEPVVVYEWEQQRYLA